MEDVEHRPDREWVEDGLARDLVRNVVRHRHEACFFDGDLLLPGTDRSDRHVALACGGGANALQARDAGKFRADPIVSPDHEQVGGIDWAGEDIKQDFVDACSWLWDFVDREDRGRVAGLVEACC